MNGTRPPVLAALLAALVFLPGASPSEVPHASPAALSDYAGTGSPWIHVAEGYFLPEALEGPVHLRAAVASGRARAVALVEADVTGNGLSDLVVGYAHRERGIIGIRAGTRSRTEVLASARDPHARPWGETMVLFETELPPEFLAAGDFDGDGLADILAASRASDLLVLHARSDGPTPFSKHRTIALPGTVTALETGEMNRQDGYPDVAVGVAGPNGGALLLFEGWHGAFSAAPAQLDLPSPPTDLQIGQFDDHYAFDLAVASPAGLTVYSGHDRSPSHQRPSGWNPAVLRRIGVHQGVVSIAAGNMQNDERNEIALIDGSGELLILQPDQDRPLRTGYRFDAGEPGQTPILHLGSVSSLPGADLVIVERSRDLLHILHAEHYAGFSPSTHATTPDGTPLPDVRLAPISFQLPPGTAGAAFGRINGDSKEDVVTIHASSETTAGAAFGRINGDSKEDVVTIHASSEATTGAAFRRFLRDLEDDEPAPKASIPGAPGRGSTFIVPSAPAAVFTVETPINDWDAVPGDGVCANLQGLCSFQAAVQEANAHPGHDLIDFSISTITTTAFFIGNIRESADILGTSMGRVVFEAPQTLAYAGSATAPVKGSVVSGLALSGCLSATSTEGGFEFIDNYLGTDATGNELSTATQCVSEMSAPDGLVRDNVVSHSFRVKRPNALVVGNRIGVSADGTKPLGLGILYVVDSGHNTRILNGNVLASASAGSEAIMVSRAHGTLISGNTIGGSPLAPGVSMGAFNGIGVMNARGTTIRTGPGGRNVIVGNAGRGVVISVADSTVVQGNFIGANGSDGIYVYNSAGVVIGGTGSGDGNAVIRNTRHGIALAGNSPVTVEGNFVGVDPDGEGDYGNEGHGVYIEGNGHRIGAPRTERFGRNIIAFNRKSGIFIRGAGNIAVEGNYVGTNETGAEQGNGEHGVYLDSNTKDAWIGGVDPSSRNTIAFNALDGVFLWRGSGGVIERNRILGNEIYDNGKLGINLDRNFFRENEEGVNQNDSGYIDTGTNGYQNYPDLSVNPDGSLGVRLDSRAGLSYRIEVFGNPACDPSGYGEGREFLHADTLTTGSDGIASATFSLRVFEGQEYITATATDPQGNTSEFSACARLEPEAATRIRVVYVDGSGTLVPASRKSFQVGRWEPSGLADPFRPVGTETTNEHGILTLRSDELGPGDPFVVRTLAHAEPAVKLNHEEVDNVAYEVLLDNLTVKADGGLEADLLAANPSDTTEALLRHTTLSFNLTVSIQWKALDGYVDGLESAFRNGSDYLYDVTNGQAQLGRIAIYDNATRWNSADVQIHADNTLRDNADEDGWRSPDKHARLSPKSYGFGAQDRNKIFADDTLDPNSVDNFRTIVHELGHYLFGFLDEYMDAEGNTVHPLINYGFMDTYYPSDFGGSQAMKSEMSMFVEPGYTDTKQFVVKGKTSWQQFEQLFARVYGGIEAPILTPEAQGVAVSSPFVPGPNEVGGPLDYPTGALLGFVRRTGASSAPGKILLVKDGLDRGVRNVEVRLDKVSGGPAGAACFVYQGQTTDRGEIRLLGADLGDRVELSADIDGVYLGEAIQIADPAPQTVILARTESEGILPSVESLENGDLVVGVQSGWTPSSPPELVVTAECGSLPPALASGPLPAGKRLGDFAWALEAPPPGSSVLSLVFPDEAGVPKRLTLPFFVAEFSADRSRVGSAGRGVTIELAAGGGGIERVAVLSSGFPPSRVGLPDSLRLVSLVHAVDLSPASATVDARLMFGYESREEVGGIEGGITVYRLVEGVWEPLDTAMDLLNRRVTARIDGSGVFGAFMDLTITGTSRVPGEGVASADGLRLFPPYPNPFSGLSVVSFELPEPGSVRVAVYDLLGRRVRVLEDGVRSAGRHELVLAGRDLPSGTYLVVVESGRARLSRTVLVAR